MNAIPLDDRIKRILVVNFGGIGDEILFFPVIQSLREAYPTSRITALVEPRCKGIGEFNPAIDEVLSVDVKGKPSMAALGAVLMQLRRGRFDLAIGSGRSALVPLLLYLSGARYRVGYDANRLSRTLTYRAPLNPRQYAAQMYYDLVGNWLNIPFRLPQVALSQADREWAKQFLADAGVSLGEDPVVVIHPGTSRLAVEKKFIKSWPPTSWAELAIRLQASDIKVVLAGGPDDAEAIRAIRLAMPTEPIMAYGQTRGLGQLAALIAHASVLACVDSAPMHLGVATGTPTVAIFGPTDPARLLPSATSHQAVGVEALACRPCLWDRRSTTCDELTCLKTLSVETVESAIRRVMPARNRDASHP